MRVCFLRALLAFTAATELVLAALVCLQPEVGLGLLGRPLIDVVMTRQYGLLLLSVALMDACVSIAPLRYRRFLWVVVVQRALECGLAFLDWRAGAIATPSFVAIASLESIVAAALLAAFPWNVPQSVPRREQAGWLSPERGLSRLLVAFGAWQLFWGLASTIFVQVGSRLLNWPLQDPYATQQQGVALFTIGLSSVVAAGDASKYRLFVCVPIASQVVGIVNSINERRLGTISWSVALLQWTIESSIAAAFIALLRSTSSARSMFGREARRTTRTV